VLGNFDRDSAVVRYRNEHELLYSSPKPLALLSAPPFHDQDSGVSQPIGNCYTAFGKANGNAVSTTESMGWSIGYKAGIQNVVESESTVSFERKFDSTTTHEIERAEWITYATGAEDSVVFTSLPFDVYSTTWSGTAESKITAGGVSLGASAGFSYGFGIGLKTSNTTAFTGRVSNIAGRTPATAYDFGLFARQVPFGEGESKVLLVDYWVK